MNIWQFIERHPVWSIIALIITASVVETIGSAIGRAVAGRK